MAKALWDIAERFYRRLAAARKPDTAEIYLRGVKHFIRFIEANFPEVDSFKKVRRSPHIEQWLVALAEREPFYSIYTRETYIRALIQFFRSIAVWRFDGAPRQELISYSDAPRLPKPLPKALTLEDDRKLIAALKADPSIVASALLIVRRTGIRLGEMVRLPFDCIERSSDGLSLRVPLGKTNTERVVPIDDEVEDLIRRLQIARPDEQKLYSPKYAPSRRTTLVIGPRGGPIHPHHVRARLLEIAADAGLQTRVTPHRLRHTFATELATAGISIPALMRILGHSAVQMTMRYITVTAADVVGQFKKAADKNDGRYVAIGVLAPRLRQQSLDQSRASVLQLARDLEIRLAALERFESDPGTLNALRRIRKLAAKLNQRMIAELDSAAKDE